MSTSTWTRLYRPFDLDSYVGNTVVKKKVESMFKYNRVPQTILLEGDRGCGKTTLARILAKNLMCEDADIDGLACEECRVCKSMNDQFISKGETPQGLTVYEVDITKSNSIDDANTIVEQMRVKPMGKKKKVYILDEIQRASKQAQNSFLKVTEEPGSYLYIILCTTDPEDLIDPFKSRFNSIKVRRPGVTDIMDRLEYICRDQNLKYDKEALRLIASQCNRIPRESINKLSMIGLDGNVTYENALEELQMVRVGLYREYVDLLGGDIFYALQFIEDLYEEHGIDWGDFLSQLADYVMDAFNMKSGMRLDKYTANEYTETRKVMKKFTLKDIARFLKLIKEAMLLRDNPRYALTMLTLEMGYPEYMELPSKESMDSVRAKETSEGMGKYMQNKRDYKKKKQDNMDFSKEATADELMNILEGSELVDVDVLKDDEKGSD